MAVETVADRNAMLADFGETAKHTNEFEQESELKGIFDNTYSSVNIGIGEVDFAESNPTFMGKEEDFTNIRFGDRLYVRSKYWIIREIQPDGTGFTELSLELE